MTRPNRFTLSLLALILVTLVAGCGIFSDKTGDKKNLSVEALYKEAKDDLDAGNYAVAIKAYELMESRYPYGRYAQQAQLDIAYAYYKQGETAEAVSACDRFLKLHPNHPSADYALYLKGLAYFKPDLGLFGDVLNLDPSERDPKALRDSFEVFKELVVRFPDSNYASDSRSRMAYLVNALAKHDIAVARYYLNRGAYLAAVNRAQNVLQRYPQAPVTEEALVISVLAYEKMSMTDLAEGSRRVLEKNFPQSKLFARSSAGSVEKKPWWKLW